MLSKGRRILDTELARYEVVNKYVAPWYLEGDDLGLFIEGYYVDDWGWLDIFECYPEYQYTTFDKQYGSWGRLCFPSVLRIFVIFKIAGYVIGGKSDS